MVDGVHGYVGHVEGVVAAGGKHVAEDVITLHLSVEEIVVLV